jgi:hypothetical protein
LVVEVVSELGMPLAGVSVGSQHDERRRTLAFEETKLQTDTQGRVVTEVWGEGRYLIYAYSRDGAWSKDLTPEHERRVEPGKGEVKIRIVKGK